MIYSRKILAKLGKMIIIHHPEIANDIIKQLRTAPTLEADSLQFHLHRFCEYSNIDVTSLTGPVYKSALTESRKIFINAILIIYGDQDKMNKTLSNVLKIRPSLISKTISEVKFRYKKEDLFNSASNKAIQYLQSPLISEK